MSHDNQQLNKDLCSKICSGAPFALVVVDPRREVVLVNDIAERYFSGREGIEKALATPPEQAEAGLKLLLKMLDRTMRDGMPREFDVDTPYKTDSPGSYNVHLAPLCADEHGSRAVAIWARDVTGYRQMSDRLIAAEKMASLGAMAGGVAHHFNTIIGGLTASVDAALTNDDPAAARRALKMTSEAIAGISKLTRSLMSFAEQDSRRADLADLTEVLLTFVQLVERPLSENGIEVNLALSRIPIVAIETNRMHQVLGNLLTNAEEAMNGGGQLTLSTGCDDRWVWLDFADTGSGIKPEHVSLVFEPFFTTKGLLSGSKAGNPGLGLSVAHGLVLEMGGEICVQPVERGACLRIRFPNRNGQ